MTKPKRAAQVRSRLSNGSALFLGDVDGRSKAGRVLADVIADLTAERGGREALTVGQLNAVRNYAGHVVMQEQMLADMAKGKPVNAEAYGQIGDRMARQMRLMGPPKTPQRPTLEAYLAAKNGKPSP
jgi:hypothetical protein